MKKFDIMNPADWSKVVAGDILEFPVPGTSRKVALDINSTGKVTCYVSHSEDMSDRVLLGSDTGMFTVRFSTRRPAYLEFESDDAAVIYISGASASHVVNKVGEVVFTTVEPQGRRNTDYDRMVMLMRLNEKRREKALEAEIAEIRAERQALAAARQPAPEVIEKEEDTDDAAVSETDA